MLRDLLLMVLAMLLVSLLLVASAPGSVAVAGRLEMGRLPPAESAMASSPIEGSARTRLRVGSR